MNARAEFVSAAALETAAPEWRALCARAVANPFAEPDFLLPLLAFEAPRRPIYALVRADDGKLIGAAVIAAPPLGVGLARVWVSPYAALPAIALDSAAAPRALAALAAELAARTRLAGLMLPFVESDAAVALPLPHFVAGRSRRAALRLGGGVAGFDASLDAKRRTKWARQGRKLAAQGRLETLAGEAAVEAFFEVERKGWKGERRTALADEPKRLAFARDTLARVAKMGRLDAMALVLDGRPVAAGLVLIAGHRAFYWKTAYDEDFAATSPGVQLTLAHSRRLATRTDLDLVDSCAVEDHPMIGRVWSDSIAFQDVAIGLREGAGRPLAICLAAERVRVRTREGLKRCIAKSLGR